MKTTFKVVIAALALSTFVLDGCKKGEGDPFMSLASRKARVSGDWKTSAGSGTRTYVFASTTITETITYDGTTETTVSNPGNQTSTDKYTQTANIEKDGTFKMVDTDNNQSPAVVTTTTGTWNFTGGIGDNKKKAQIVFTILSSQTDANPATTYTGSSAPSVIYDIYELKGKEMIWYDHGTSSPTTETRDIKWTMIPQ